jgi:hypothetical protein
MSTTPENEGVTEIEGEDLDDRRLRGTELYEAALRGEVERQVVSDSQTIYRSSRSKNGSSGFRVGRQEEIGYTA